MKSPLRLYSLLIIIGGLISLSPGLIALSTPDAELFIILFTLPSIFIIFLSIISLNHPKGMALPTISHNHFYRIINLDFVGNPFDSIWNRNYSNRFIWSIYFLCRFYCTLEQKNFCHLEI